MPKPPCILFLFDWRPVFWSTREEYFRQLAVCLRARGITAVLVASELDDAEVRRRFEEAGARIETASYHASPFRYAKLIRRLGEEFSIQFAHVRFFDYFSGVHWTCRLAGVRKIVFTEANSGEARGTGWRGNLVRLRTAVMCHPVTHMIAISEFIRERLQYIGVPARRITVVYNGVDTARFQPDAEARCEIRQQMNADENTVVLLFAAVLLAWKRPEIAVRVCADLLHRGIEVQLWMAGTGPLREDLEREAESLGVGSRVRWLGHQKEPQRWMAAADLFLHTAVGEAFGNVFVEAMACGLPAVATASGAAPELVPQDTGKLVPAGAGEIGDLAEAVLELSRDRQRWAAYSEAAIRQSKRFSTEACVANTIAVYKKVLGLR